ncbi:MAG: hypothetical protein RSE62_03645 [Citrobacter sp.]
MSTKSTKANVVIVLLKLVGIDTYINPRLAPASISNGEVCRVTADQAEMMHRASEVIDGDPENTWFQEMPDNTRFDHDFTPLELRAEAQEQVVESVVVTTRRSVSGPRKGSGTGQRVARTR